MHNQPHSPATIEKIRIAKQNMSEGTKQKMKDAWTPERKQTFIENQQNEKNPMWKGDKVGLYALHRWVEKRKPKPKLCGDCKETKPFDLANVSGKYLRDINDYKWLCRKCHMESDGRINKLLETSGGKWKQQKKN